MLEKKAGNFLTDGDIRNIFNQFDRLLCSSFRRCSVVILVPLNAKMLYRDSNGYLGAHDLAVVYRSLGENLEDDLVHPVLRCANDSSPVAISCLRVDMDFCIIRDV